MSKDECKICMLLKNSIVFCELCYKHFGEPSWSHDHFKNSSNLHEGMKNEKSDISSARKETSEKSIQTGKTGDQIEISENLREKSEIQSDSSGDLFSSRAWSVSQKILFLLLSMILLSIYI